MTIGFLIVTFFFCRGIKFRKTEESGTFGSTSSLGPGQSNGSHSPSYDSVLKGNFSYSEGWEKGWGAPLLFQQIKLPLSLESSHPLLWTCDWVLTWAWWNRVTGWAHYNRNWRSNSMLLWGTWYWQELSWELQVPHLHPVGSPLRSPASNSCT